MKPSGIDKEGRIVIPKTMRDVLGIRPGDDLSITMEDRKVIIQKRNPGCEFCGAEDGLVKFSGKNICKACLNELKNF